MIAIEKHLIDNGYEVDYKTPSSIDHIHNTYRKDGSKDILVGLGIVGKGIYLLSPVFFDVLEIMKDGKRKVCESDNPQIGMREYSFDEIIHAIDNGKVLLLYNGKRFE